MSYEYLLDSFAWIEYFRGSNKGHTVKNYIENESTITPTIVLAELSDVYEREKNRHWERDLAFITSKTVIIDLDSDIASNAGRIKNIIRKKYKTKFGLADAIILATSRKIGAKVITGDQHFKKLKNVIFL